MAKGRKKKTAPGKAKAGYRLPRRGHVSLEAFLNGQRQINGSFYEILDKIMDQLGAISAALSMSGPGTKSKAAGPLARTKQLVEDVPGIDPPGCLPPGGGPPAGGG